MQMNNSCSRLGSIKENDHSCVIIAVPGIKIGDIYVFAHIWAMYMSFYSYLAHFCPLGMYFNDNIIPAATMRTKIC